MVIAGDSELLSIIRSVVADNMLTSPHPAYCSLPTLILHKNYPLYSHCCTQLCRAYKYNTPKYSLLMLLYSLHTAFFPFHDFPIKFFCPNSTLPAVCSDIMIMKRKKGQKVQKNTEKRIESIKHWPQYYVFREHRSWRVH